MHQKSDGSRQEPTASPTEGERERRGREPGRQSGQRHAKSAKRPANDAEWERHPGIDKDGERRTSPGRQQRSAARGGGEDAQVGRSGKGAGTRQGTGQNREPIEARAEGCGGTAQND